MIEQDESLNQVAAQLIAAEKKVQLIYAFNGSGKTRLSRAMKGKIAPKLDDGEEGGQTRHKILYYNAFTEDLFYWDNDLEGDAEPKLKIQPNSFTDWILGEQGKGNEIIANFQHYASPRLTPTFEEADVMIGDRKSGKKTYPSVSFSFATGDDEAEDGIKISKGEESNFIWSVFLTLIEEVVSVLNIAEPEDRPTDQFDALEYVFIDDPVTSLDDNNCIELAQRLATLIKSSPPPPYGPRFIITTHNPLFYNVLHNAFKKAMRYRLCRAQDGTCVLEPQQTDSPFSYHLHLLETLKSAAEEGEFKKFHYNLLRNVLEKTSTFLGYENWEDLLPLTQDGSSDAYLKRIVDISSHSKHSGHELSELSDDEKRVLGYLVATISNREFQFPERYRAMPAEEDAADG